MTEAEAIIELKHLTNQWANDEDMYSPFMKYEVDQKFINAVYKAENALEKQIPKKPNKIERKRDEYGFIYQLGECPLCGKMVTDDRQCCDCGQKLDWSEV